MDCCKCIHANICNRKFNIEEYGYNCEEYKEDDNRIGEIINKLECLKKDIIKKQMHLSTNGIEYLFDRLINWMKCL